MTTIPFSPPYIDDSVVAEVTDSLRSGWITTGPKARALEEAVGAWIGNPQVLCCNSATSGMMLALKWYGIGAGDEVIVPAYTFCATALAAIHCGATPVMVDVEEDFNLSARRVAEKISPRTKAVIAVDVAGWPCDYDSIRETLESEPARSLFSASSPEQSQLKRVLLVSDGAHAFGATVGGRAFGTQADITVFSFHAVKNVSAAEGGCLSLCLPPPFDNAEIRRELRLLTLHGQTRDAFTKAQSSNWRYDIVTAGFKMNLPDVCAAIALAQLRIYAKHLLPERRRIVSRYLEAFAAVPWTVLPPIEDATRSSSRHLFTLRMPDITEAQRDRMMQHCFNAGIAVNVHFVPLPQLTLFRNLGYKAEEFPVANRLSGTEISLPVYPQLTDEQVDRIIATVKEAYGAVTNGPTAPASGSPVV